MTVTTKPCYGAIIRFEDYPTKEQIRNGKRWLIYAMRKAEKDHGQTAHNVQFKLINNGSCYHSWELAIAANLK